MAVLPSSLPLSVRTVEWMRMHHFNWLVDGAEHVYYTWKAPKKGGPQLKTLPAVGLGTTHERPKPTGARQALAAADQACLRPCAGR